MISIRLLMAAWAMAFAAISWAGTPTLVELGRQVPGFGWPGQGRFAVADFDGDGHDDIVVPGASGTALFQVLGQGADGLVSKQQVFVPDAMFTRVLVASIAGSPQLVTVSAEGRVRRFAGWPLVELPTFDLQLDAVGAAAVGDIDNDGAMELVVSHWRNSIGLHAYALESGELLWSIENQLADDILLAQLDADPALEIVLATTPGLVIDGATQATDWSYPDGFGSYLASGRFQAGGGGQFVAARDWDLLMTFQGAPWSPMWDLERLDIDAIATADLDGDGFDDIVEGDGQWGAVNILDGHTGAIRLSIPHTAHGMSSVAAWDPDGDGERSVAFSARQPLVASDAVFTLVDSVDGATLWRLANDQGGPYQRLAVSPHAGSSLVYPVAQPGNWSGWAQVDAASGQAQWRSPIPANSGDPFHMLSKDTLYVAAPDGPQLVLAGQAWSVGARFMVLDAATHAVRWVLDSGTLALLQSRFIGDIATFEPDGTPAIVTCVVGGAGARIVVVDAATGTPSWSSVEMSLVGYECGLMIGRFADGASPLVVAVLDSSLHAFDAATHVLAWSLPGQADGASLLERGVTGREFVVFEGSWLHFHDAGTRGLLRSFDIGTPVDAVKQLNGDVHHLLVAAGGHLLLVDGSDGAVVQASGYLGNNLGKGNRIATVDLGGGYTLIGVGSDGGVFRYRLYTGDGIFTDGFESPVD